MHRVEFRPYEAEHGLEILKTLVELHNNTKEEMESAAHINKENSQVSQTLFIDDEPIVSLGIFIRYKLVGDIWMAVSNKASRTPKLVVKTIRKYLNKIMEKNELKRLQTPILSDFTTGLKFASALGWKCETPDGMKYYGFHGETYKLFSLIKED